MILYIQIILIFVLALILIALHLDERHKKKTALPPGKLRQYWDGSERRRFVRVPDDVPVRYTLPKTPDKLGIIKTRDISVGGICIVATEKLTPKLKLRLEIELNDSSSIIVAKGEVIWVSEDTESKNPEGIRYFNIGIEFIDIPYRDREKLSNFVKRSESIRRG
jgi:c-di-GMP-binding flagellar brake protein YcgR